MEFLLIYTSVREENQALCLLINGSEGLDEFGQPPVQTCLVVPRTKYLCVRGRGVHKVLTATALNDNAGVCLYLRCNLQIH